MTSNGHSLRAAVIAGALALVCAGCGRFRQRADAQFGDQNFKSAIALIELHKVRFQNYPDSLRDLQFTGLCDQNYFPLSNAGSSATATSST